MRVGADGSLAPIPGQALTPQPPSYPKGFQPPQCSTLTVDPNRALLDRTQLRLPRLLPDRAGWVSHFTGA